MVILLIGYAFWSNEVQSQLQEELALETQMTLSLVFKLHFSVESVSLNIFSSQYCRLGTRYKHDRHLGFQNLIGYTCGRNGNRDSMQTATALQLREKGT